MEPISNLTQKLKLRPVDPERLKASQEAVAWKNAALMGCRPDCPVCAGLGYYQQGPGGPIQRCPHVDLLSLPYSERFGISAQESKTLDWEHLIPDDNNRETVSALRKMLDRKWGWIYLYGGFGTGKTRLLKTAIAETLRHGKEAVYATLPDILDQLEYAYRDPNPDLLGSRLDYWSNLPILAIDEVDKLRNTDYRLERQFLLLDKRYVQACNEQSLTLMAGNHDPAELPAYIYDRICDGRFQVIELRGASFRPGMGK